MVTPLGPEATAHQHSWACVKTSSRRGCWRRLVTLATGWDPPEPSAMASMEQHPLSCFIVLQLTTPPVNTRVLAFLSSVAGDALTRHLGVILPAVMLALKEKLGTPDEQLVSVMVTRAGSLTPSCPIPS